MHEGCGGKIYSKLCGKILVVSEGMLVAVRETLTIMPFAHVLLQLLLETLSWLISEDGRGNSVGTTCPPVKSLARELPGYFKGGFSTT